MAAAARDSLPALDLLQLVRSLRLLDLVRTASLAPSFFEIITSRFTSASAHSGCSRRMRS